MAHPLAVKGSKSENRWSQTRHEIFSPLPLKLIAVAPSGAGKSSVIQATVNALFDHFNYFAVYFHSYTLDPSDGNLTVSTRLQQVGERKVRSTLSL